MLLPQYLNGMPKRPACLSVGATVMPADWAPERWYVCTGHGPVSGESGDQTRGYTKQLHFKVVYIMI